MLPEKFISHPFHEKIEQLREVIENSENRSKIGIDNLSFFDEFIKYCQDRIDVTIPTLVQVSELDSLSAEITRGIIELNNFIGNNNPGHVNNSINSLNSALNRLRNLPSPFLNKNFDFSSYVAKFQQTVKEKYDQLEELQNGLNKKMESLNSEIKQNQGELEKFKNQLIDKGKQIDALNLNFQNDFNTIKNQANQNFSADRTKIKESFDSDKKDYKNQMESFIKESRHHSEEIIKDLNNKLEEAKRIVNVVGDAGITGKYQEIANKQGRAANIWRIIAFSSMLIMCILLIYTIWDISQASYDITKSIIRIIAAFALSYPATYASRESSRFRNLEIKNRSIELELTSLNPFIELLPEEKKQTIKEKLVEKYFGNSVHNELEVKEASNEELSIGGFERIIKLISGVIKK